MVARLKCGKLVTNFSEAYETNSSAAREIETRVSVVCDANGVCTACYHSMNSMLSESLYSVRNCMISALESLFQVFSKVFLFIFFNG